MYMQMFLHIYITAFLTGYVLYKSRHMYISMSVHVYEILLL